MKNPYERLDAAIQSLKSGIAKANSIAHDLELQADDSEGAALDRAMYLTKTLDLMNEMCPSQLDVMRRVALILLDAHEEKPVEKMRLVKSDVMH
jgi:hypothetical protein